MVLAMIFAVFSLPKLATHFGTVAHRTVLTNPIQQDLALPAPAKAVQSTELNGLFTDNMVLQRGKPIPIWGIANPGQKITVTLHDQTVVTLTDPDGYWKVTLKPMVAGGPYTLNVRGNYLLQRKNVAIGEVWLLSGQSNMEFHLIQALNGETEVAEANNPDIRFYHVNHRAVEIPLSDMNGAWSTCRPETAKNFSAIGYLYAKALYAKLHVPIGLIEADWGGTSIVGWIPRPTLLADPVYGGILKKYIADLRVLPILVNAYEKKLAQYDAEVTSRDPGNKGFAQGWAKNDFDDSKWQEISVPGDYKATMNITTNGAYWYRRTIDVPESAAGSDLTLQLGAIDDFDVTYFNGAQVGKIGTETHNWWAVQRSYVVPGTMVKAGKNEIAIRVWNISGTGGLVGPEPMQVLGAGGFKAPLDGTWKFGVEFPVPEDPGKAPRRPLMPGDPWSPGVLHQGMIAGLGTYGLRGVLWYQGESDADRPAQYRTLFPMLINSWRKAFAQGDIPFYFVQLANYSLRAAEPVESSWAELREAQASALALPNTGMATAIDLGAAETIHPLNKQDVAKRLAMIAFANIYGFGGEYQGPTLASSTVEGSAIRLKFTHIAGGLYSHGGPLIGFQIAGADRKFVWANAQIEGYSVVVSSPKVPNPVAVRYAWDINPQTSLYNGSGLPAPPFRTDSWESPADGPKPVQPGN